MRLTARIMWAVCAVCTLVALSGADAWTKPHAAPPAVVALTPDKGTFAIIVNGKQVGKEDFGIAPNGQTWIVHGNSEIQAAGGATHITGNLEVRGDGSPVQYQWTTDGDKKAACAVTFDGNKASVEPHIPGAYPYSQQFTFNSEPIIVLDNNLYDQYGVLARLYNWSKKGVQTFSVLVPQEITGGTLTVESLGSHDMGGKKLEQLLVKTEGNEISVFYDGQHVVRISVPGANAEIVRQ
jgi:hypothetical protein